VSIAKSVVSRPVLSIVVFALLAITGLYLFTNIAVDMWPEMELPYLMVYTTYPGADPETVEKTLTKPLESGLANISGLKNMRSTSQEQASVILLQFDYGVNTDPKMNRAREAVDLIRDNLPPNAGAPVIAPFNPLTEPVLRIAVRGSATPTGAGRSQNELRAIAKDLLLDRLEQIEGVGSASVEGGQDAIVRVQVSQNRLEAYGITITEIAQSLALQNMELGAGSIEDNITNYAVRTSGEFASITDIAQTVVAQVNGIAGTQFPADVRLMDIAEISLGFQDETSTVYINGEPGVYISLMKQSGANSVAVANQAYKRLEELKALLPPGVSIEVIQDNTIQTRNMIQELINSAWQGILLSMLILLLFLRNINGTIIIGLSIPLSVLITILAMSLAGITLNIMTMTGLILGVGMIVDSSIVILENIYKFRERGEKPSIAAILGGDEVMASIVSSTLTSVCVYVPILLFKNQLRVIGIMTQDMIFTIGISLLSSMFVAMFLVPALAGVWIPVNTRMQKPLRSRFLSTLDRFLGSAIETLTRAYSKALSKALRNRPLVIILVISAFAGSVLLLAKFDIHLMPDETLDVVNMQIEMPQGTRYEDTLGVMLQLQEYAMAEIEGAKSVIVSAGKQGMSYGNEGSNTGKLNIKLDLDNPSSDTAKTALEKLKLHFADFPDTVFSLDLGEMSDPDIDILLRVNDIRGGMEDAGNIIKIICEQVPEVGILTIDTNTGLPQVEVQIDRGRAYNMGLSVVGIAREIAASMTGITATSFNQNGEEYNVILMLEEADRSAIPDLEHIFVRSSSGGLFPVSNFASLKKSLGPVSIAREDQTRVIHITGDLHEGAGLGENIKKIEALLGEEGYNFSFSGDYAETQELMKYLVPVIILALLLVFGIMAGMYESFKDPFINFCTIPLILLGVSAIHLITGQPITAFTMIGFVMLTGIVVNNGIILVDYTNILVRRGVPVIEACLEAGASRLRPVLMTALTTILGIVPMAFFPGASASMTQPIGIAIIGGLSSATFITLFFIPVLYSMINAKGKEVNNDY
jgi:HAE1 family hydrophobic/amphiphilic exporter-1